VNARGLSRKWTKWAMLTQQFNSVCNETDPIRRRLAWPHLVPPHQSMPIQGNTFSISIHHWFQVGSRSRAQKRHCMDCWTHRGYVGDLKDTKLHTHVPKHRRGHHTEGGRPTHQWRVGRPPSRSPDPLTPHYKK
jgi:hypothetical protein